MIENFSVIMLSLGWGDNTYGPLFLDSLRWIAHRDVHYESITRTYNILAIQGVEFHLAGDLVGEIRINVVIAEPFTIVDMAYVGKDPVRYHKGLHVQRLICVWDCSTSIDLLQL